MKKILITGVLFLFAVTAKAQTTIYNGSSSLTSSRTVTLGTYSLHFRPSLLTSGLYINSSGNVGINSTSPTEKLDINGNVKATAGYFTKSAPNGSNFATNTERVQASLAFAAGTLVDAPSGMRTLYLLDMPSSNMDPKPVVWFGVNDREDWSRLRFRAELGGNSQFILFDKTQTEHFAVTDDGVQNFVMRMAKPNSYVCIGTSSYIDGSDVYKLSVSGKVRAHEVKVYNTWADYVFENDYDLKSLEQVEAFIAENGHLPNVPSAKEVEAKGIELGEMTKIQQEKIEELTLYLIQQNKENQQLKEELKELKALVNTLIDEKK
ncbi:hypothetical protein FUA48_17500 [Flavobacterium alkalisoli]|uniref:Cell wall anchor protein n=1 Tax=Flavobacterium alkalisoli TaxID=2602769 RepID=A0A5B9FWI4_9FLAO|nr:hypothetical protein [Flavobacterium alkalisoli]QEE51295.1 hypothetical protein FUA48_17500 [Flavobacterium alkalisoli]